MVLFPPRMRLLSDRAHRPEPLNSLLDSDAQCTALEGWSYPSLSG